MGVPLIKIASVVIHRAVDYSGNGEIKAYGKGRICAIEGCGTHLSQYNPSSICSLHRDGWETIKKKSTASAQPKMTRVCAYDRCQEVFETTNEKKLYHTERCRATAALERAENYRLSQIGRSRPLN